MSKFDAFFKACLIFIYEWAKFDQQSQQLSEMSKQLIMALYQLANNCEYDEMKDELIRNRMVVGIWHNSLSERLQVDPALTLETA